MDKEKKQIRLGSIATSGCEGKLKELLEVLKGGDVYTARMLLKMAEEHLDRVSVVD